MRTRAEQLLRQAYGPGAIFREAQWEAISALVEHRRRLLVVQRTGWGKSLVYFIATKLLRELGRGPTIVVSPLLSLMRNQLEAAEHLALSADTMNSTNRESWADIKLALQSDKTDLLLVSPEQVNSPHFSVDVLPAMPLGPGLVVVDEAHCISDWGHDFRPDYRRIARLVKQLPRNVPVLGATATANQRVVADVAEQLGPDIDVQRGPLARPSLTLQTIRLSDQAERLAWLAEHMNHLPGTGIVYCLTVADCERVATWLCQQGIDALAYHAKVASDGEGRNSIRLDLEQRLKANSCKALVATVALGMGYDKPDLGFVVHYQRPGSVVAYYQQVGRAGRSIDHAVGVLLNGREDDEIQEYFIQAAFPDMEQTLSVVQLLERQGELTLSQIMQQVNLPATSVTRILKFLTLDGVVGREKSQYFRTANPIVIDLPRQEMVTRLRRAELARMQEFVNHSGCLMEFIAKELDDPFAEPCGGCASCRGDVVPRVVSPDLVQLAVRFLQRDCRLIEPRKQWKAMGHPEKRGAIPEHLRVEQGRALCMWGDAGWGTLVRDGKYDADCFSDELVEAVAEMIERYWDPKPRPTWVTAVPSVRQPDLVPGFARRLAARLGMSYHPTLHKIRETKPQKQMRNSVQQCSNALDAFGVSGECLPDPVLLVDDMVDSRWTLTVCGALLREAGSGPVYPVALAVATSGGDPE